MSTATGFGSQSAVSSGIATGTLLPGSAGTPRTVLDRRLGTYGDD